MYVRFYRRLSRNSFLPSLIHISGVGAAIFGPTGQNVPAIFGLTMPYYVHKRNCAAHKAQSASLAQRPGAPLGIVGLRTIGTIQGNPLYVRKHCNQQFCPPHSIQGNPLYVCKHTHIVISSSVHHIPYREIPYTYVNIHTL